MKTRVIITSLSLAAISYFIWLNLCCRENHGQLPAPTNGQTQINTNAEESDDAKNKREAWIESMHKTAPGLDWRQIELENQLQRHQKRLHSRQAAQNRSGTEVIVPGIFSGEWKERGSLNQAGSVFVTRYDEAEDKIYLISAGGTLFRGELDGSNWEVINQDIRFDNKFLYIIPLPGGGKRMISAAANTPMYSDDMGLSWSASTGINMSGGGTQMPQSLRINNNNYIYLLSKPNSWDDVSLYRSIDNGLSYELVQSFGTDDFRRMALCKPHNTESLFIAEKTNGSIELYEMVPDNNIVNHLQSITDVQFGADGRANLIGTYLEDQDLTRFFIYDENKAVHKSDDLGQNWEHLGNIPTYPWEVSMYVSPTDPDFLVYGEVECYKSYDGGANWGLVNGWGEYYSNVEHKLHADMMYFNEIRRNDGTDLLLISNHGGLNISDDKLITLDNIGLEGLNVAQYYDVVTDPSNPYFIVAGSQDQGFQRSLSLELDEVANFEQVISGDYGHMVFRDEGKKLWMVYPFGWISYYAFPTDGYLTASWTMDSEDESVWIPPIMAGPDPEEKDIYLAGGNIDGGPGSYIVHLDVEGTEVTANQLPYNFSQNGSGVLTYMTISPLNSDLWFATTSNGKFYYSTDAGQNWDISISNVPNGHYLYGTSIYASKFDENTVYMAGSGYSNHPVLKSVNQGQGFVPMSDGLPSTLVFEITANDDESLFFAATEAGPYVYVVEDEMWYDMSGDNAPAQTYWSVEYVSFLKIVRFGTYGRGIWDFQVEEVTASPLPETFDNSLKIYPNPAADFVNIELEAAWADAINYMVYDMNGKLLLMKKSGTVSGAKLAERLDIQGLASGTYLLRLEGDDYFVQERLIVQ